MSQQQQGIFQRAGVALFGERTQRLRESTTGAHALSYLLVTVQSAAVVLALGHQQLQLLLSGDPTIVLIAGIAVFLLVASVVAADLCLLATLQRLPVLARNRSTWSLIEHLAYLAFVLLVEGSTLALVLAVLDTDPHALVSRAPIIPAAGALFGAMIAARAALTCWTAVQLWIVRGKLPPQWSTLLLEARELLGGKAQQVMSSLNLDSAPLASLFDAYAQMSRPPARVMRWWNKGLIAREQAALAEEDRQREAVVRALSSFDMPSAGDAQHNGFVALTSATAPDRPPTGPGTPWRAPGDRRAKQGGDGAKEPPNVTHLPTGGGSSRSGRTAVRASSGGARPARRRGGAPRIAESVEPRARAVWVPGMSVEALRRDARISRASAQKYHAMLRAEDRGATRGRASGEGVAR
jgi:hypothetical protein